MKILIISNIFPPGFIGGYELAALDIANGLSNVGHDVHVLTSSYFLDDQEQLFSLSVSRSLICTSPTHDRLSFDPIQSFYYNFHNIRVLGSIIRRFKPDVVLAFNLCGLGVFSIIEFLQKIKMPTILYLMDNIFSGFKRYSSNHQRYENLFGALQFNNTTRIVAMSYTLSKEVSTALNLEFRDVTFIPGWVDFNSKEHCQINTRQGGVTRFVFCSRIASHKGISIVLEATNLLIQRGLTQFSVDVYGMGQVAHLLQQVKAKNLDQHIFYKGCVAKNDILKLFSQYDALLFPTWEREPFGFVVSEAAVAGCFPIMTGGIGASEWFLDGHDCLKIFRDNISLCSAMSQVMYWSDEEFTAARSMAMKTGRANFSFERWLSLIEQECLNVSTKQSTKDLHRTTKGVESAFLYLSSLLRKS